MISRLKKMADQYIPTSENERNKNNDDVLALLMMLREDMKGEVDAINNYENHINNAMPEDVKKLLEHILFEEREHSHELHQLIEKYEKDYSYKNSTLQE